MVCTSAARWLFDLTLRCKVDFREIECDTGLAQLDSLRLDEAESVRRAAAFHDELESKVEHEAIALEQYGTRLVVGDIPPLAFAAAARARVPSVALANFTWDWIYEGYPEWLTEAPGLVPTIRAAYANADAAWRLPLSGGFSSFTSVIDFPFIARRSRHAREALRAALDLPQDLRLVLVSFGGYGLARLDFAALSALHDYGFLVTNEVGRLNGEQLPGVFPLNKRQLYASGYRYEDLVAAVDVVATKPGYGIVAECIANDAAILYTSRGRFAEYDVFVAEMPRFVRCRFIDHDSLRAGTWRTHLDSLLAQPPPPESPRTDGADLAADGILEYLDRAPGTG